MILRTQSHKFASNHQTPLRCLDTEKAVLRTVRTSRSKEPDCSRTSLLTRFFIVLHGTRGDGTLVILHHVLFLSFKDSWCLLTPLVLMWWCTCRAQANNSL